VFATRRRISAPGPKAPRLAADLADLGRVLLRSLTDTYRPELHYMRGPGPKWHARHDRAAAIAEASAGPARVIFNAQALRTTS
jgi:hypothetical protein